MSDKPKDPLAFLVEELTNEIMDVESEILSRLDERVDPEPVQPMYGEVMTEYVSTMDVIEDLMVLATRRNTLIGVRGRINRLRRTSDDATADPNDVNDPRSPGYIPF